MPKETILGNLDVHRLNQEWAEWRKDIRKLRFGQYIANRYCKSCWSDLYYEQDHDEAFRLCLDVLKGEATPSTSDFAWERRCRA
jgi:hypothetical protein